MTGEIIQYLPEDSDDVRLRLHSESTDTFRGFYIQLSLKSGKRVPWSKRLNLHMKPALLSAFNAPHKKSFRMFFLAFTLCTGCEISNFYSFVDRHASVKNSSVKLRAFSDSRVRLHFTVGAQHYAGTFQILNRRIDLVASIYAGKLNWQPKVQEFWNRRTSRFALALLAVTSSCDLTDTKTHGFLGVCVSLSAIFNVSFTNYQPWKYCEHYGI